MPHAPRTLVCVGKDCRRDRCHQDLLVALDAAGHVTKVRCQDICKGPVAGVEVDGTVEWFRRVRKPKHRKALVKMARRGRRRVPGVLESRWVSKRSGKVKR